METAELASSLEPGAAKALAKAFEDEDSAVRYWGAMGILMREKAGVGETRETLLKALSDASPSVRVIAAQALGQYGEDEDAEKALDVLVELASIDENGVFVSMLALNAIDAMDERAKSAKEKIASLPQKPKGGLPRMGNYVPNLISKTVADLD
jgi:uncharacterized sulfatase